MRTAPPPYDIGTRSAGSSPEWMYHELLANPTLPPARGRPIQKHFFNDGR